MRQLIGILAAIGLSGCLSGVTQTDDADANLPTLAPCQGAFDALDHQCLRDGLGIGEQVFWNGGQLPSDDELYPERPSDEQICATLTEGGLRFSLPVVRLEASHELRVDLRLVLDDPQTIRWTADSNIDGDEDAFMALYSPVGDCVVAGSTLPANGALGITLAAGAGENPAGNWTVAVKGALADWFHVLLRAHVAAPTIENEEPLLPDLVIIPPFEIGFNVASVSQYPGVATETALGPSSCMAEEFEETQGAGQPLPILCLRYSMGLGNLGPGEFMLRDFPENRNLMQDLGLQGEPLVQVLCSRVGTNCSDAKEVLGLHAQYHQTHFHLHYQNSYIYDLLKVEDATADDPSLEVVAVSGKLGLNPTNEVWLAWDRFDEQPIKWSDSYYVDGATVGWTQRLAAGWGDVYDWTRSGNFVDFPRDSTGMPVAGDYVLRGVSDPLGQILESNETNNVAYAFFSVTGDGKVTLHERGYGTDPWDPMRRPILVAP